MTRSLILGLVEQKTAGGARFILAQVALGTAGGFAAFDNLIPVTVRTLNGDERRHGPLLGEGSCRDLAHSDIDFTPSPRLEHYPIPSGVMSAVAPQIGLVHEGYGWGYYVMGWGGWSTT